MDNFLYRLLQVMSSLCTIALLGILVYMLLTLNAKAECDHPTYQEYMAEKHTYHYEDKSDLSHKKKNAPWRHSQYSPRGYRTSFIGKSYPNYSAKLQARNSYYEGVTRL